MKKIMFNDKYGLTDAVLQGRKTMTRRQADVWWAAGDIHDNPEPKYKVGEVLAVAQAYKELDYSLRGFATNPNRTCGIRREFAQKQAGWSNKMFVSSKFMPHQIRITNIKVERLQDISEEDCLKEGVLRREIRPFRTIEIKYQVPKTVIYKDNPRDAFATLIDKVSGKGTWERNPYVFAYTFELIK